MVPGTVGREGKKLMEEIEDFLSDMPDSMLLEVGGADFMDARSKSPDKNIVWLFSWEFGISGNESPDDE